jgi:hypothetical protein
MILERDSANNMKELAIKHGMITMTQDALLKAVI